MKSGCTRWECSVRCYTVKMFKEAVVLLAIQALLVSSDSVCPDRDVCENEHTCCQGPTGEYNCCPHHQGECCDDHLFCCPEHTICLMEEEHPRCVNATLSLPRTERIASRQSSLLKSLRVISASPEIKDAVVCPDKSFCPAEFSCVKLPITFGCCPITQGIVCSDGKHCCPEGLECSSDGKSCVQPQEPVVAVICGDGKSECPEGTSCSQSSDGLWGCCPFPRAVYCDDDEHCCPKDSTCDVKNSKCISSTNQHMPMWAKFPARLRADWEDHDVTPKTSSQPEAAMAREVPCDDKVACEDGNTCCKTTAGDWACCPLPKAVCCDDHIHCCPEGTTCDTAGGSCLSATGAVSMLTKLPALALPPKENDVTCDSTASCPDGTTCCKNEQGQWACCPLPEAVCCDDHIHCCPKGTTCDTAGGSCLSATGAVSMLTKLPALALPPKENDVTCDSTASCPDGTTCCKNEQGQWACCPLPEAVCCDDHIHCCPKGTTCDTAGGSCLSATGAVSMLTKLPALALPPKENDVTCDSTASCPDGTTCCKNEQGQWACCPLPEAVCCDDHIHCCPKGTTCDTAGGSCLSATGAVSMLTKLPALALPPKENDVTCDSTASCPDGTTCCKNEQGQWACCPLPEAVCCDDHIHCCPKGTTCDTAGGSCLSATGAVSMLTKLPALALPPKENDVTCDSTASCPDGTTCCKNEQGQWACCPLPEAVCCDDHIHCCPKGTTCDTAGGSCLSATGAVSMLTKLPALALPPKENDVTCDSTASCPDGTTCCKNEQGQWACCPLPEAVCCDDHIHCCPKGTTCDTAGGSCLSATGAVSMLTKLPALALPPKENDVTCDSTASCPDGTTCCKNEQGQWACCPLPEAVCCDDHIHCCPKGTTCDTAGGSCLSATGAVSMLTKLPATTVPSEVKEAPLGVKCDSTTSCPDHTTCCFMKKENKWGCCPFPNALCCEDGEHCCPAGYKCNTDTTTCTRGDTVIPWYNKLPAQGPATPSEAITTVTCDSDSSCPSGSSCCQLSNGKWGCCPLIEAVCCSDQAHCCPRGYTCNLEAGSCEKSVLFQAQMLPLIRLVEQEPETPDTLHEDDLGIHCDDQVSCPIQETCCMAEGGWGCCPAQKATCCADKKHCCPAGYTCGEGGTCIQATRFYKDNWQVFFSKKKRALVY
ncbi:granulin a isoform X2 [Alosa pseudoharengus]|uniref:granulin a isoform X2 n=1 Tax=Alosa pseudoharengus TaxID=34774 RepID=UPI003F8980D9